MADQIEPDRLFPVIQLDRFIGARFALGQIAGKLFQMTQLPVGQGQPTVIADANDEVQPLLFEQEAQPVGLDEFTVGQQTAGVGFEISPGAAKQFFRSAVLELPALPKAIDSKGMDTPSWSKPKHNTFTSIRPKRQWVRSKGKLKKRGLPGWTKRRTINSLKVVGDKPLLKKRCSCR